MMDDQANGLRRLMEQRELFPHNARCVGPRLILVTSGKGGTGTTSIALGLATAATQCGRRVAVVDASPHGGDLAMLSGVEEPWTIADVLSSRATIGEAMQSGPGGVRVLAGAWGQQNLDDCPAAGQLRLMEQLRSLKATTDDVFIDGGSGSGRALRRFWDSVHCVVAVTTPDVNAVMDTYASIKLLSRRHRCPPIYTLVNRATSAELARDTHDRLARCCKRFLAMNIDYSGYVSEHPRGVFRKREGSPPSILAGRMGREIRHIVEVLATAASPPVREAEAPWEAALERLTA